jgi:hypothetical protein
MGWVIANFTFQHSGEILERDIVFQSHLFCYYFPALTLKRSSSQVTQKILGVQRGFPFGKLAGRRDKNVAKNVPTPPLLAPYRG